MGDEARGSDWTVEEANAALPRVRAAVERIRALAAQAAGGRERAGAKARGNGHAPAEAAGAELAAAVEELTRENIVLRDLDSGLVDFPAVAPSGRRYWLCWLPGEAEVGWWHWPEDGFAGRTPLDDPPR
jgi:hypothetical protein